MTETPEALIELERLLTELETVRENARQVGETRRALERKISITEREWHAKLAEKQRGIDGAAEEAERIAQELAEARHDLAVATAEQEGAAVASAQVSEELRQLFVRELPVFITEANKTGEPLAGAAGKALEALRELATLWREAVRAWDPLVPALMEHVHVQDLERGLIRGNQRLREECSPRVLPDPFAAALSLLGAVGDRFSPRPVILDQAVPIPEAEVISMDLRPDIAAARAKFGDA